MVGYSVAMKVAPKVVLWAVMRDWKGKMMVVMMVAQTDEMMVA